MRHKLKDVKREVKRETIKLKHAVMPRGKVRHLSPSWAACTDNKYGPTAHGEFPMCECCLEGCGDEKCKGCDQPLCSDCCFASEEPPMRYCPSCVFPGWHCQSTFSKGKEAKKEIQERKGTIKKAAKLKKSKVTKTTDDEYYDEWVEKTIRFLGERPPEQHHWALLCQYISKLSNGSPKRFCP